MLTGFRNRGNVATNGEMNTIRGRGESDVGNGDGTFSNNGRFNGTNASSNSRGFNAQMFQEFQPEDNRKSHEVGGSLNTFGKPPQQASSGYFGGPQQLNGINGHCTAVNSNASSTSTNVSSADVSAVPPPCDATDAQSHFTAQAQLIEALAMQSLQESQFGKELTQALANHLTAQLGHSNAELLAAKGKVLETMALLEKAQQHAAKLNHQSSTVPQMTSMNNTSASHTYAQPVRVNTNTQQAAQSIGPGGMLNNGPQYSSTRTWSGSSTPNSAATSINTSGCETQLNLSAAKALNAQLKLLQQKGMTVPHPRRVPPQSPVPGFLPTGTGGRQKLFAGFPRNNGFRHPFFPQPEGNMKGVSPAVDATRNARSQMTTPDLHGHERCGVSPHLKDLPIPPR